MSSLHSGLVRNAAPPSSPALSSATANGAGSPSTAAGALSPAASPSPSLARLVSESDRRTIRDLVSRIGLSQPLHLRHFYNFLLEAHKPQIDYVIECGIFDADRLARELGNPNPDIRRVAGSIVLQLLKDNRSKRLLCTTPTFTALSTLLLYPTQYEVSVPVRQDGSASGHALVLQRNEILNILGCFMALLDIEDEDVRYACWRAPKFMERIDKYLDLQDESVVVFAACLYPSLARSYRIFRDMLRRGTVSKIADRVLEPRSNLSMLISCVWNCCVFPEGTDVFLDKHVEDMLLHMFLDVSCLTDHPVTPAQRASEEPILRHSKAAGALAEMCLMSDRGRRVISQKTPLDQLGKVLSVLTESAKYNNSKFSALLFAALILPRTDPSTNCSSFLHRTLSGSTSYSSRSLLAMDDVVGMTSEPSVDPGPQLQPQQKDVRSILDALDRFVLENDPSRAHGWGWDQNELQQLLCMLDSPYTEVRRFTLWSVALTLRTAESVAILQRTVKNSPIRAVLIRCIDEPHLIDRGLAAAVLARLRDFPETSVLEDDVASLHEHREHGDMVFEFVGANAGTISEVPAHMDIICCRSRALQTWVLDHIVSCSNPTAASVVTRSRTKLRVRIVEGKDFPGNVDVFFSFVEFCYLDIVAPVYRVLEPLMRFARQVNLSRLQWMCEDALVGLTDLSNFGHHCALAAQHGFEVVREGLVLFAKSNAIDVVRAYGAGQVREWLGSDKSASVIETYERIEETMRKAICVQPAALPPPPVEIPSEVELSDDDMQFDEDSDDDEWIFQDPRLDENSATGPFGSTGTELNADSSDEGADEDADEDEDVELEEDHSSQEGGYDELEEDHHDPEDVEQEESHTTEGSRMVDGDEPGGEGALENEEEAGEW